MSEDESDPFKPVPPKLFDLGRLYTHGTLSPGWECRWCRACLSATPAGGLLCLTCDSPAPSRPRPHK